MTDASSRFFLITVFILLLILVVFTMKYAASVYRSRLEAKRLTTSDETVVALRAEVGALTSRMNAVEKLLRDVE
ncbi:hypothetical protein [Sphingobium sp. Leaf26]|uniref:hypothetical protein n=1 Tax=Sphingobium sp. Leaf26 TaxID=1735693 RepID=UPI000B2EE548|nr:hypothetical protein [Sphingobium sp. Leaf26]